MSMVRFLKSAAGLEFEGHRMKKWAVAWLLCWPCGWLAAAVVSQQTATEVKYLLGYLEHSGCSFNRNGSWYSAAEAKDHLQKKYQYLLDKNLITNAESFIAGAASKSSMSDRAYRVRCASAAEQDSGPWFRQALEQYRETARSNSKQDKQNK